MEWQYGIDTSAHVGALEAKGKTIAVLGGGFENIFPEENKKLFEEILSNNGTIISEYLPEAKTSSNNFRERNRIVSGLSMGVLVIEAAEKSGTGITINYARRQKKPIFSIPSSLENKKGVGTNRLLKRDGILVTSANDIFEYYRMKKFVRQVSIDEIEENKDFEIRKEVKPEYKEIYDAICGGFTNINQIKQQTKKDIGELNSKLLIMELEGLIKSISGNEYKLN